MKKAKLFIMAAGVATVFAFTGCSSGSAANNLGRMIDGGTTGKGYNNNTSYYNGRRYGTDGTGFSVEYGLYGEDGTYYQGSGTNYGNTYMGATGNKATTGTNGKTGTGMYSGTAYGGGYANLGE